MLRGSLSGWMTIAAISLLASSAQAEDEPDQYPPCDETPTEGDVAAAKGAFQAGQAAFNEADYPRAITYWEDAYRRDCTAHALLLNLSRAYELNGQPRHAIASLEAYNERTPHSAQTEQNERRIEKLRERIAEEQEAAAAAPPPSDPAPPQETDGEPKAAAVPSSAPPDRAPEPSSGGRAVWPLFVAGGGAALGIAGGVWWFTARGAYNDYLDEYCPPNADGDLECDLVALDRDGNVEAERAQELKDAEIPAVILTSVGGAAVVAGVVLYFVLPAEDSDSAQRTPLQVAGIGVTPSVGSGYAGLSLDAAF